MRLNLLHEDSAGSESCLIIATDKKTCSAEPGGVVEDVVGHIKIAADHLFNSSKHKYRQQNWLQG